MLEKLESIEAYKELLSKIQTLTNEIKNEYPGEINCKLGCCDCCNNIFNISIIEAYYLQDGFQQLSIEKQDLIRLNIHEVSELIASDITSKEDIFCPLLVGKECALYDHRPIICRTYGYPMLDQQTGNIATCHKNFNQMREEEYTLKTISTKLLSAQTVVLSQFLLTEKGKTLPDNYIPPLYSILEVFLNAL